MRTRVASERVNRWGIFKKSVRGELTTGPFAIERQEVIKSKVDASAELRSTRLYATSRQRRDLDKISNLESGAFRLFLSKMPLSFLRISNRPKSLNWRLIFLPRKNLTFVFQPRYWPVISAGSACEKNRPDRRKVNETRILNWLANRVRQFTSCGPVGTTGGWLHRGISGFPSNSQCTRRTEPQLVQGLALEFCLGLQTKRVDF